jgi:hypothetical protein
MSLVAVFPATTQFFSTFTTPLAECKAAPGPALFCVMVVFVIPTVPAAW